ncbi:MAG: QacE family quaternary ammonium compound efflux SMR transporter [Gammaproteobacteria bacterium]|nr:MAG: QacE family quaternary ammonium compound efflux SMR transporter [Gammaproteobacteria bacterium]
MQSWLILIAAIVLEVAGTTAMKLSDGFTRPLPSVLLVVFYLFSLAALTLALKRIDVSVAYAIWAGMGTVLVAIVGVLWFREPLTLLKVVSILLIAVGVVGLHLSSIAGEH